MQTKNALGFLTSKYRAVVKKCHLLNTFGSLAVASMLVMGATGLAGAAGAIDTYTFEGNGILGSGTTITAKNVDGVDGTVDTGASLTLTGGGTVGTDVNVSGVVNIAGSNTPGVTTAENQTNILDTKTVFLASGGVINVHNNGVLVLDDISDLSLAVQRTTSGTFNIMDDGAVLLKGLDSFNGANITNIAGVMNSFDVNGAAQNLTLQNVNLQDGARIGTADTTVTLSGTITVDSSGALDIPDAEILGNVIGAGVTGGDFNGDVYVNGNYYSAGTNTLGTAGFIGRLYIRTAGDYNDLIINANANADADIAAGDRNETFNVRVYADTVTVTGGDNNGFSAQATFNELLNTTGVVNITGGAGGADAKGGDASVIVAPPITSDFFNGVNITGGDANGQAGGDATLTVQGTLKGGITTISSRGLTLNNGAGAGESVATLNVTALDATDAHVSNETKFIVTAGVSGNGVIHVSAGKGSDGTGFGGGDVVFSVSNTISPNISTNYTAGTGGAGGATAGATGGDGGDVTITYDGGDVTLKGGTGGAGNVGAGGKGGDMIFNVAPHAEYTTVTLTGGDAGAGANGGAGGKAIFNVTNKTANVASIVMGTANYSIVNVKATTTASSVRDTTFNVGSLGGAPGAQGAQGVINIGGMFDPTDPTDPEKNFTATMNVTGAYTDSAHVVVNIDDNGVLNLAGAAVNSTDEDPAHATNILAGAYNLNGGTLRATDLSIDADNFMSEEGSDADVGQINFSEHYKSLLDVDGTLTVTGARSGVATIMDGDGVINIETQSLKGGTGVTGITIGDTDIYTEGNTLLTFTGGGSIDTALTVTGAVDHLGIVTGGTVYIKGGTTKANAAINIKAGGDLSVTEGATLDLQNNTLKVTGETGGLNTKVYDTLVIVEGTITGTEGGTGQIVLKGGTGGEGGFLKDMVGGKGGGVVLGTGTTGSITHLATVYEGGDGGKASDHADGGAGGEVAVGGVDGASYILTGGARGADKGSNSGGVGGDAVLYVNAQTGTTLESVTLNGHDNGGKAIFNVTNETANVASIVMGTANYSIVNVTATAASSADDKGTLLNVGSLGGTPNTPNAQGVINITGTDDFTATLVVTGTNNAYVDSADLKVNIGPNATLDLRKTAAGGFGNNLDGAYSLNGGTLKVTNLRINASDLGAADAISFHATNGGLLDVDGTLIVRNDTAQATIEGAVNIHTQGLAGGTIASVTVTDVTLGDDKATADSKLTFTGGGEIATALIVTGQHNFATNKTIGGVVNIVAEKGADGTVLTGAAATTTATRNITIDTGGVVNVNAGATLTLEGASVKGDGALNVAGGTLNATAVAQGATEAAADNLDLTDANVNVNVAGGGVLGTAGFGTILGTGSKLTIADGEAGSVAGILVGQGVAVNSTKIDGTLNVDQGYQSQGTNTFDGAGTGIMNITGSMVFDAGDNDTFNVAVKAGRVSVNGGDDTDTQPNASVTFTKGGSAGTVAISALDAGNATMNVQGGEFEVGAVTLTDNADLAGEATLRVTGETGETGFASGTSQLTITGVVTGNGIIEVVGGTGERSGAAFGGTAELVIADTATFDAFTGTLSLTGGTGGDAVYAESGGSADGGTGGSAETKGSDGKSYTLTGGTGGHADGDYDGGTGGDAALIAVNGHTYDTITLHAGKAGNDAEEGTGGKAGHAEISVGSGVVAGVDTLQNTGGLVNIVTVDDYEDGNANATLTVNKAYSDTADASVTVMNGTLDLSTATVNRDSIYVPVDTLAGAYNIGGTSEAMPAQLIVSNLTVDAASLVSSLIPVTTGQINIADNGLLVVKDTLTIDGDGVVDADVNIKTQSLALASYPVPAAATQVSTPTGVTFNHGTIIFTGGTTAVFKSANASPRTGTIGTNVTIAEDAQMVVSYTADADGTVIMPLTTLAQDKSLTITAGDGLNIIGGATLDVSAGTLVVTAGGFADGPADPVRPETQDKAGLGTLIVDDANLGFTVDAGVVSFAEADNDVKDDFWGALKITGFAAGDTLTLEEYNKLLVDGENALIQGQNATLELMDVKIDGLFVLSELEDGTVARKAVEIGTGLVDNGGTIIVGSVIGNYIDSIIIDNGSDLSITGEPDGGALFTQIGKTATVQVKDGDVRLGVAGKSATLGTDIMLGAAGATAADNTTGHVAVYGELDMTGQTISSFAGTSGNTVTVMGGGALTTAFDMVHGDALNVTADTLAATTTVAQGSDLGDITVTGGTVAGADATVNITGEVDAAGDVTLTGNTGDAILNIVGGSNGEDQFAALNITGNFTSTGGTLNLTAGDAGDVASGSDASLDVTGTFTSTTGDINLTGGNASAANDGGRVFMTLNNATLNDVNITSGTGDAAGGMGGRASFTVDGGEVTANSVTLTDTEGAKNAALSVTNSGDLTVNTLNAATGDITVATDSTLMVATAYTDSADTTVAMTGTLDLSETTTNTLKGYYSVNNGTLLMDTLNIASTDLVGETVTSGAGKVSLGTSATLITDTLHLTDAAGTATLHAGNLMTGSLSAASNVGVIVNTALTFTGGGSINASMLTGQGSITIGAEAGRDGGETAATTTTLADKTLDASNLNILEGHALDTTAGTLRVSDGGFADTGTGQLTTKAGDYGTFTYTAATKTEEATLVRDATSASVLDKFWGDLALEGVAGGAEIMISQDEYDKFLVGGADALIQGNKSTLWLGDNVSVKLDRDAIIANIQAGMNYKHQVVNTGYPTDTKDFMEMDKGGKVIIGGIKQSDPDKPVDLHVMKDTILALTAQGDAKGEAFDRNILVRTDAAVEVGAVGGAYIAYFGGAIQLEGESTSGAGDGATFTAVGDTEVAEGITAYGMGSAQVVLVKKGSQFSLQLVSLPTGTMHIEGGAGVVVKEDVQLKTLSVGDFNSASEAPIDTPTTLLTQRLTVEKGRVYSGRVTTQIAQLGDMTFGFNSIYGQTWLSSGETYISGITGFDPAWRTLASENTMQNATQGAPGTVTFDASATGKVGLYVGRNAMVAIGTNDTTRFMTDMQPMVDNADFNVHWGNPADNANNTSAALAFYEGLTLTPNASLVVDGDYVNVADSTDPAGRWEFSDGTPVTFKANTANFAANSLALIHAPAFLATDSVVLSAGTGSTLTVDADAKLVISGGKAGQTIDLTEGMTETIAAGGWTDENLISSSSLLRLALVDDATDGYTVEITSKDANATYTMLDRSMGNLINNMMGELGADENSLNMGQRFITRLTENEDYGFGQARPAAVASAIESAASMAQVGAVSRMAADSILAAGNANVVRNTATGLGANGQAMAAVTLDAEGGLSAGSDMGAGKNGVGLWLMPLYKWNNVSGQEAGNFGHGYTSGLGGIALGADYTFNDMFRVGMSFNVGAGYAESDGDLSTTNNSFDFWGLGVYGAYINNNLSVVADIGYTTTYNDVDQDVSAALLMTNNKADVTAHAWTFGLTGEYTIKTDVLDIVPHAGVRFVSVTTGGYDVENSGGTVFSVESDTQNVWYFPVGVTLQKDIDMDNGWHVTPKLDLGFIAAAGDLEATSNASIPGVTGGAELNMKNVDGFAFNGGLGLDFGNENVTFGLNYNIVASEHEVGHMVFGSFRFEF